MGGEGEGKEGVNGEWRWVVKRGYTIMAYTYGFYGFLDLLMLLVLFEVCC